jgi:hypothetical protein
LFEGLKLRKYLLMKVIGRGFIFALELKLCSRQKPGAVKSQDLNTVKDKGFFEEQMPSFSRQLFASMPFVCIPANKQRPA